MGTMGRMRTNGMRKAMSLTAMLVVVAMVVALAAPRSARAAEQYTNDFGVGIGTVFANLLYMPVKFVYATLGGLTGGFAFCLTGGRMDTASAIWRPSLGGTYVVTPSMLRGEDPIYFSGSTADHPDAGDEESDRGGGTPRGGY